MSKALSTLPAGSLVKDAGTKYNSENIIFRVLGHNHDGSGLTSLECRDIITLKCFDAKEPNNSNSDRQNYGNNRYQYSNLLQWLNSDSASWYTAKHSADQKPDSSNVWVSSGTPINPYDTEAGFLSNFSPELKAALQTVSKVTALNTVTDGGGYETVSSKIFLLSTTEVGLANENNVAEGSIYAYYAADNQNSRRVKNLATEAAKGNYSSATSPWRWWLRTPYSGYSRSARLVDTDGSLSSSSAFYGSLGVSPAYALLSSLTVSDAPDSDGAYILEWNSPPSINTDSDSLGDKNTGFSIDFDITDADADAVSATISLDGTTEQTISSVVLGQTYTFPVSTATLRSLAVGAHTITISATDGSATTTKNITFNRVNSVVAISGSDEDKGNIWLSPTLTYQVTDTGGTSVNITESIDGSATKTITGAPLGTDITFDMSTFDQLSDEALHTLTITATNEDSQTATRTWTFTKLYDRLSFYSQTVPTDAAAKKIHVVVDYEKTGSPTLTVEVTNNGAAVSPTWEDATNKVLNNELYEFTNEPTSGFGVAVRITLMKNSSTERVYLNDYAFSYA